MFVLFGNVALKIPFAELEEDVLEALLQEIVTRNGTDYGEVEISQDQQVRQIRHLLETNQVVLYWNSQIQSASILSIEEFSRIDQSDADSRIDSF